MNIRQNLQGRILDIEKANLYNKYVGKIGELFTGEVYQTWAKEVLILDEDGNELRLPKSEQIPGEHFKKNDTVRAIIKSVEMKNNTTPYIVLSRTTPEFLEKLFEQEVPEIYDGLITIKKVFRGSGGWGWRPGRLWEGAQGLELHMKRTSFPGSKESSFLGNQLCPVL